MTCADTLFLNKYSQLKKLLKLKKTSVKTLLMTIVPNIVIKLEKC